jgi:hypothetical protein
MNASERRGHRRVALRQPCTLHHADGSSQPATLCDLATDGASFMSFRPIAPGTRLTLAFDLGGATGSGALSVAVRTRYSSFEGAEGFRIGVAFRELDDADQRRLSEFLDLH